MKSLCITRDLDLECYFSRLPVENNNQVILHSLQSGRFFCETENVDLVLLDCRSGDDLPFRDQHNLVESVYQAAINRNPKISFFIIYDEQHHYIAKMTKKNSTTCFLEAPKLNTNQIDYLINIHSRQEYRGVFLRDLEKISKAVVDLYIYYPFDDSYQIIVPKDQPISTEIFTKLKLNSVSQLFVRHDDFNYFYESVKKYNHLRFSEEYHAIRKLYKHLLTDLIDDRNKLSSASGKKIRALADNIVDRIVSSVRSQKPLSSALSSLAMLQDHPLSRGLNAVLFSVVLGDLLKTKSPRDLGLAALFYRVGNSVIPELVYPSHHELQKDFLARRSISLRYVEKSVEILKSRDVPVSPLCLNAIGQHREHYDGSGYPLGLRRDQISEEGLLLCFINQFVNRYTLKSFSKFLSLGRSLEEVKIASQNSVLGNKIDPKVLSQIEAILKAEGQIKS